MNMQEYRERETKRPNLYQRLVGALVLIALAVIILPMILDFRADQVHVFNRSNIPDKPEGYRIEEVPLAPAATVGEVVSPGEGIAGGGDVTAGQAARPAMDPAPPVPELNAQALNRGRAGGPTPGGPAAWVVQVGSFSSQENALALRDRLRSKGYPAFIDRQFIDGKPVVRVRVGPEVERARSEQLRERLVREMNLQGTVVSYE